MGSTRAGCVKKPDNCCERFRTSVPEMQKSLAGPKSWPKARSTASLLFEGWAFNISRPIDGHNFEHLLPTLENALKMGPVLLHVITKKGLDTKPRWIIPSGSMPARPLCAKRACRRKNRASKLHQHGGGCLIKVAHQDKRVVAITAAMCEGPG